MLPNKKNDLVYLINVIEYIGKIWKYTEGANDPAELYELNEQMNLNASLALIANIGENISKITDDLKQEYPNIEWQKINQPRRIADGVGCSGKVRYLTRGLIPF
jgi:uncharacterized protein with HEPN domain